MNDLVDHLRRRGHVAGVGHGPEDLLHRISPRKVTAYRIGNEHGVFCNLRLSKGFNLLSESPYDGERQSANLDRLSDCRILAAKGTSRKLVGYECDLVARHLVLIIKEAPGKNQQVADDPILRVDAKNEDVTLFASTGSDAIIQLQHD